MHRTEGANNLANLFRDGPPGTTVEEDWLNAIQEEIAYVIEQAGLTLKTANTETRTQLKEALDTLYSTVPVGAMIDWPTSTPPTGWLERDGSSLLRVTYAALFAVIGTTYGAVDVSHFNLPDDRGKFPRYWNHGAGIDPDAGTRTDRGDGTVGDNVGTKQTDAFQGHYHSLADTQSGVAGAANPNQYQLNAVGSALNQAQGAANDGVHGAPRLANETRAINNYVMPIIKYA